MIASASSVSPSFSSVRLFWKLSCTPSKLRFMRTFTTPEIASEPYTDDAPPVRISTLSISAEGTVLRSTKPLTFEETRRVPSSSTNVRDAFTVLKPRRSTFAWPPFEGLFEVVVMEGTSCGSVLSTASTCTSPDRSKAAESIVTTGLGASKSCRTMRVPVTITSLMPRWCPCLVPQLAWRQRRLQRP